MASTYETPFPTTSNSEPGAGNGSVSSSSDMSRSTPSLAGSDVMARVVQGAHETVDRLAETAAPQVQRVQEGVSSASEMLNANVDKMKEVSDEWAESLRGRVRENPLMALAAALAVGMVIARLSR